MSEPISLLDSTPSLLYEKSLYEKDFFLWSQTMAVALRSGDFSNLDIENLAEEVESLGRSDRQQLDSRLTVLLVHVLKWKFQPQMRSGSWGGTINEQRRRIRKLLKESPSLQSFFEGLVDECYEDARVQASIETELPIETFPETCPFALTDIMEPAFFPD
jgi:Domain of unknown function DUF29